jgi:photolyase PhrII
VDDCLPNDLRERVRWVLPSTPAPTGEFVLYWMHHAVRGHENPALDVAISFARQLDLPLLVYHAICEEYPFASDRHHLFMTQGARDVAREMDDLGIRYVFHLQRDNHRGPHLRDLTRRAALVVTEEMPLGPIVGWLDRLRASNVPVACVDTSCLVPAVLLNRCIERAYEFREATKLLLEERLRRPYLAQPADCKRFDGALPFEPVDLQRADLRQMIGMCRIDHSIAPVADTPGGSRAGYSRWEKFKCDGLRSYAKRRNDSSDHHGVSRLSAYLHYGMVSVFRIAREAAEHHADKFLDELFVWRELAFHYCFHRHDVIDSLEALPAWARQSLATHESDPRDDNHSWESLARGSTGNRLWDACQRSLVKHGELHNNLRMTWGKAFLSWVDTPERALRMAIDLNHRYALDGRDPSSYGGLLWCFGQFDRPFQPEVPVYGHVRPRDLDTHQKRLDMTKYTRLVDRPITGQQNKIAIIGAGIGGLMAARTLADHGLDVTVFDKSRGVGGRMATRRIADDMHFDHGAQYFTARDERFTRYVQSWIHDGVVAPWHGRIVQLNRGRVIADKADQNRYVATPGMSSLARHLASDLRVSLQVTIREIQPSPSASPDTDNERWRLINDQGESMGDFDIVIANCPPVQAETLLGTRTPLTQLIREKRMLPCWAAMVRLDANAVLSYDAAFVEDSPLAWICRNDSKPNRPLAHGHCWVLHASPQWSIDHLEWEAGKVEVMMRDAFCEATRLDIDKVTLCGAHRWRYAIPESVLEEECLWDSTMRLGACGDWCGGPRVEGAFLSGVAMAGAVLRDLTIDRKVETDSANTGMLF